MVDQTRTQRTDTIRKRGPTLLRKADELGVKANICTFAFYRSLNGRLRVAFFVPEGEQIPADADILDALADARRSVSRGRRRSQRLLNGTARSANTAQRRGARGARRGPTRSAQHVVALEDGCGTNDVELEDPYDVPESTDGESMDDESADGMEGMSQEPTGSDEAVFGAGVTATSEPSDAVAEQLAHTAGSEMGQAQGEEPDAAFEWLPFQDPVPDINGFGIGEGGLSDLSASFPDNWEPGIFDQPFNSDLLPAPITPPVTLPGPPINWCPREKEDVRRRLWAYCYIRLGANLRGCAM